MPKFVTCSAVTASGLKQASKQEMAPPIARDAQISISE